MIVHVPERTIIERTFVERPVERSTEPLPSIHIEVPATPPAAAPHITVNVERTKDEHKNVRTEVPPTHDTRRTEGRTFEPEMPPAHEVPNVSQPVVEEEKQFGPVEEKRSPEQPENVPSENKKRSENISPKNSETIPDELFEPDKPAPQADSEEFEKIGPGRQRRYEELGEKDVEPIRELVLFRNEFGRHWPGLSKDMEQYYEHFYFTAPNKRKDGKNYAKHVKCWERRTKWLAATESTPDSH